MSSCRAFFGKAFFSTWHLHVSGFVLILFLLGGNAGAVTVSTAHPAKVTLLKNREYADALVNGIRNSGKSIILSCYLFKIRQTSSDVPEKVAEELIKAGNRGVDVTVIFEISDDAADPLNSENRETASFLSRNGIRVLFDSPRTISHLKAALIDDRYVFVGSHNLTRSALKYNNEVSVLVESPEIASEMRSYLKRLMTKH
ncbi:MAG TPA: phospholipase D-like domain-containing protein [Geobacteraceae bacterium]|nr:phospholipase D-like domain-containing protein [Geobacteraceae bacterium]